MTEEGNKYTSEIHVKEKHTVALPATFPALFLFPSELFEGILFLYEFIRQK